MKIIQLNIWGGKLGLQIIDFLQKEKPDFVCLQEVNNLKGRSGYKFFATLEEIKEKGGFKEVFMSPTFTSRYMERTMDYGNAILSNEPLVLTNTVFTNLKYKNNFDITLDDGNIRNLQVAQVKIGNQKLNILNHHGYHIKNFKDGNEETLRQMSMIADIISELKGPTILCGDFNLKPSSKSITLINEQLRNLPIEYNLKNTYNQLGANNEVCDYIFVSGDIEVEGFKMSNELLSDHNALILDFHIK